MAELEDLARKHYQLAFKVMCSDSAGGGFQDVFDGLMEARYPGDYHKIRPSGSHGDRKNDGYLRSAKTLFQCYGPKFLRDRDTARKIDEDFQGAVAFWDNGYFTTWTFVHNDMDGLPPQAEKKLHDLRVEQDGAIVIDQWGYPKLESLLFELEPPQIVLLLGPAPTIEDMGHLGMDDVAAIIKEIGPLPADETADLRPVPVEKMKHNAFTPEAEGLLTFGMRKAPLVERYFIRNQDPTLRDRTAQSFTDRYRELRDDGLTPDEIFHGLVRHAAGPGRGNSRHESATYAVIAYFFEFCDIFERPN